MQVEDSPAKQMDEEDKDLKLHGIGSKYERILRSDMAKSNEVSEQENKSAADDEIVEFRAYGKFSSVEPEKDG